MFAILTKIEKQILLFPGDGVSSLFENLAVMSSRRRGMKASVAAMEGLSFQRSVILNAVKNLF